jgi:hypothetical protein
MAGGDWATARDAYRRAAQLGVDPSVFRQLAIADEDLGLQAGGRRGCPKERRAWRVRFA